MASFPKRLLFGHSAVSTRLGQHGHLGGKGPWVVPCRPPTSPGVRPPSPPLPVPPPCRVSVCPPTARLPTSFPALLNYAAGKVWGEGTGFYGGGAALGPHRSCPTETKAPEAPPRKKSPRATLSTPPVLGDVVTLQSGACGFRAGSTPSPVHPEGAGAASRLGGSVPKPQTGWGGVRFFRPESLVSHLVPPGAPLGRHDGAEGPGRGGPGCTGPFAEGKGGFCPHPCCLLCLHLG